MSARRTAIAALLLAALSPLAAAQRISVRASSGGSTEFLQGGVCAQSILDLSTGACVQVASLPRLGSLYPLGPDFNIDPFGRVGLGTIAPTRTLDVNGIIRSTAGIEFPDGSVQTTAQLQGPPGSATPPEPTTVLGTAEISSLGSQPIDIFSLEHSLLPDPNSSSVPLHELSFVKDIDDSTSQILQDCKGSQLVFIRLVLGDFTIEVQQSLITRVEMVSFENGLHREKISLRVPYYRWMWTGSSAAPSSADWDVQSAQGSATLSLLGSTLRFTHPDAGPPAPGARGLLSASSAVSQTSSGGRYGTGSFLTERYPDDLTPGVFHAVFSRSRAAYVFVDLLLSPQQKPISVRLVDVGVTSVRLERTADGALRELIDWSPQGVEWTVNGTTVSF